ncbi:MAG TPA: DUF1570 domain-containing protein [Bacteroidia bacterium]|jgi:hypothetical protein|nr:DUF1570 domain-containing protein [Bacteroidia bacterium]
MKPTGKIQGEKAVSKRRSAAKIRLVRKSCRLKRTEETAIRKMVQYEYEFYKNCFGNRNIPSINVTIYGRYDDFMNAQKGTPKYARSDFGFYCTETKTITIYKDIGFMETCYHEISHFFLGTLFRMAPDWLDEGMAGYFENSKPGDESWLVTNDNWQLKRIRKLIRKNKVRIKRLIGLSYKKFHRRRALDNYAVSWGILFFFMYINQHFVIEIIRQLRNGKNSEDVVNGIYPGGILQLQKDFVVFYK